MRFSISHHQRPAAVPLMVSPAACGFPSPADDYLDGPLDFNELLIQNPAATFAVRIAGESMTGVGLFPEPIGDPTR
jgi:DNA polymerase V